MNAFLLIELNIPALRSGDLEIAVLDFQRRFTRSVLQFLFRAWSARQLAPAIWTNMLHGRTALSAECAFESANVSFILGREFRCAFFAFCFHFQRHARM